MESKKGPAARARAEGRSYKVELHPTPMTPLADDNGQARRRIAPYLPVVGACSLCTARCCRLNVRVSLPDAVHFCRVLQVPFFAGMTFVPSEDEAHGFLLDRDPRVVDPTSPWTGRAEIQLRRREDGGCHALVSVGEYERCGVYEARPSFCRTYPATWRSEVAQGGPVAVVCPVPYGIDPEHERALVEDIEMSIERWELHDDVVEAWNAADSERTIEAFLRFALPKTMEHMEVSVPKILDDGTIDQRLHRAMVDSKVVRPSALRIEGAERPFAGLPILSQRKT